MHAVQTDQLELMHFTQGGDESTGVDATWPLYRDTGARNTASVYFVLSEGGRLARHTDSAEEVLIILEGSVEVTVGEETAHLTAGGIAVVPAMVPHHATNVGLGEARVVGVFSANTIVSTFERAFDQTGSQVVGTPPPEEPAHASTTAA